MQILDKRETTEYFERKLSGRLKAKIDSFGDRDLVKVFPGKIFVVYRQEWNHTNQAIELKVLSTLQVMAICANDKGLYINFLDMRTYQTCEISYTPQLLCGYDVFAAIPGSCMVSKTVKIRRGGYTYEDVSCTMLVKQETSPMRDSLDVTHLLGLDIFEKRFPGQYEEAVAES